MILFSDFLAGAGSNLPVRDETADYTVVLGDRNVCVRYTGTEPATFTFDRTLPRGANGLVLQSNIGAISPAPESGAPDITVLLGGTKTAGKGAMFHWLVENNVDGDSAEIVVSGAMTP